MLKDPPIGSNGTETGGSASPVGDPSVRAGFIKVYVTGFYELMEALDRAERKGYMPDAMLDEWSAFDYRPDKPTNMTPPALPQAADRHVGDSDFESWYANWRETEGRSLSAKQMMRDAYAAGMGDGAPVPQAAEQAEPVAWAVTMNDGKTIQEICHGEASAKAALYHWDFQSGWDGAAFSPHQVRALVFRAAPPPVRVAEAEPAALLRRIRQWDHLDNAADGPYWKREIDAALAAPQVNQAVPGDADSVDPARRSDSTPAAEAGGSHPTKETKP